MGNISEQIEYVPEEMLLDKMPREQRERIDKLYKVPIMELLKRWSESQTYSEDGAIVNDDYWDIPIYLREQLSVPKVADVNNSIKTIIEAIDALDAKLRNHRHELDKIYSAKPEF